MKYYIIAGEASGDLHGSNLMKALQREDPNADFRIWGGDLMEQSGGQLVKHYRDLAFMGFWEVVANLRTILGNIRFCKRDILAYSPDVLILIDYPGFNLRIAKWAKQQGIRVFTTFLRKYGPGTAAGCTVSKQALTGCLLSCLSRRISTPVTNTRSIL